MSLIQDCFGEIRQEIPLSFEVIDLCDERYNLWQENTRITEAQEDGCEIIRNDSHTLTFDLDGEKQLERFKSRVGILEKKGFSPAIEIYKSRHGNYHAIVKCGESFELTEPIALAIQAALGSDWKREILGVLRYLNKQFAQNSMLFKPKNAEVVKFP